jgi:acetoin utilization deacetylase AcuC-like enzyme
MGAEGYCVNIPWSCGGVGDNDYIFAFQHIVLPIGDYIIVSSLSLSLSRSEE